MVYRAILILSACAALGTVACDDGGSTAPTPPPTSAPPTTSAQNPCPSTRRLVADLDGARAEKARQPTRVDPRTTLGDIAVIQDDGDIVTPANTFDLQGTGLRFTPRAGGYDVSRIDASFQAAIGEPITLQDDDSVPGTIPFSFNFYGLARSAAFINSDGNITFLEAEHASAARNVGRLPTT